MSQKSIPVEYKPKRRPLYLGVDVTMLITVVTLLGFGLLMLYSASWEYSVSIMGQRPSYLLERQLRFLVLGGAAAVFAFFFDYHKIKKFVIPMMLVTLIMLMLVIFYVNEVRLGARRGLFQGSIQPSELAKLVVIIYLAFWLHAKKDLLHEFSFGLLPMAAILGISSALILFQPDLSAAATIFLIGGLMFFMGGGEMRQIIPSLIIALVVGILLILVYSTGQSVFPASWKVSGSQNGFYHVCALSKRLYEAVCSARGLASQHQITGLPVAPTDSIFAVIAEKTGIIGACLVIIFYPVPLAR